MPSDTVYALCTSGKTVTAAMEQDPTQAPAEVARKVFPEKAQTSTRSSKVRTHDEYTEEDLERALKCGNFPKRPSDLFLRVRCLVSVRGGWLVAYRRPGDRCTAMSWIPSSTAR